MLIKIIYQTIRKGLPLMELVTQIQACYQIKAMAIR